MDNQKGPVGIRGRGKRGLGKGLLLAAAGLALFFGSGCAKPAAPGSPYGEGSVQGCALCGEGEENLLCLHWGEENVGILSLNTMQLAYVEINRYEEGRLVEAPGEGHCLDVTMTGNGGFSAMISSDANRGYASGRIDFNEDAGLDWSRAREVLCDACLDRIRADNPAEGISGVGLIDFKTGEIRLLRQGEADFLFGDFYVSYSVGENSEKEWSAKLLLFYAPQRY